MSTLSFALPARLFPHHRLVLPSSALSPTAVGRGFESGRLIAGTYEISLLDRGRDYKRKREGPSLSCFLRSLQPRAGEMPPTGPTRVGVVEIPVLGKEPYSAGTGTYCGVLDETDRACHGLREAACCGGCAQVSALRRRAHMWESCFALNRFRSLPTTGFYGSAPFSSETICNHVHGSMGSATSRHRVDSMVQV